MTNTPRTAFLFPGMNCLLKKGDRFRFLSLPEVRTRIDRAEDLLRERKQFVFPLRQLLESDTQALYALDKIHFTTILISSIQLGVVDRLRDLLPEPDWVVGCSVGDIARSVYAEAVAFEDVLQLIILLADEKAGVEQLGSCIVLLNPRTFAPADLQWLETLGLAVCRLSPRRLLLAGGHPAIAAVRARTDAMRWKSLFLIDRPFHSPALAPKVMEMTPLIDRILFRNPQRRIFSSVLLRPLTSAEELRIELKLAPIQPFDWQTTTRRLIEDVGITRFVNVGPCQSLANFVGEIAPAQEVLDAGELIEGRVQTGTTLVGKE